MITPEELCCQLAWESSNHSWDGVGGAQIIRHYRETRALIGGSEPRKDGRALWWQTARPERSPDAPLVEAYSSPGYGLPQRSS